MASSSSSSNHINSSTGGDLREISIQLRAVQVIQEEHRPPQIYAVRFCDIDIDSNTYTSYFASVGGNCASVYEAGTTDSGRVQLVQGFLDEDVEEVLYTCCWTSAADGNPMLIVAGLRGILKCINCATFVIDATLFGHGNAINDLRRHVTDDALIFSASKDESIRLWNIRSAVCVAVFAGEKGHRDEVLSLDVHLLGHCFVSTGMDTIIKIWNLAQPSIRDAIERSHQRPPLASEGVTVSAESLGAFQPVFQQVPIFSTNQVHTDYVDTVRWFGNCLLTKSTKNRVAYWSPDSNRYKGAPLVLREFEMQGCEIWFVRMDICIPLDLLAVGNKFGKVFLFSLSGNLQSATVLPSSSTTSAAAGSTVGSVSIRTNLNAPADGVKRRKVKSGEEALQDETLNKILTVSEEDDEGEEVHTTQSPRNVDFILPERFECAHPQKPLAVLSHPRCGSAVRQVSFSASLRHLVYGCDDGSIWCWDIII